MKNLLFLTEAEIISRVLSLFEETWEDYWSITYEKRIHENPVLTVKFLTTTWYFRSYEASSVAEILDSIEAYIYDCHDNPPLKRSEPDQYIEIDDPDLPF